MSGSIMWFRRDLRLADNAALVAACVEGPVTLCVFAEPEDTPHAQGAASRQWRHASIAELSEAVSRLGGDLEALSGDVAGELTRLASARSASTVHCTRDWSPEAMAQESRVRARLEEAGVRLEAAEGQLLVAPDALLTGAGGPYRVFTPYYRAWRERVGRTQTSPTPTHLSRDMPTHTGIAEDPTAGDRARVDAFGTTSERHPIELARWWHVGEDAAHADLAAFTSERLAHYEADRDIPSIDGSSRLSPRLAHGELSARQVFEAAVDADGEASEAFVRQLAWRDFAYHVLHHFPHTSDEPLKAEFAHFPWNDDQEMFEAWRSGFTGFEIVDAGMRQLLATGWMHNRVRLVAGSLLTKDLLVAWQRGEAWFREALVDYDPALNAFNWQWVAGSGADAAPYFRIFSPDRQAERFDAHGRYRRRWIPELGSDAYPAPIVDHAEARRRALAAYQAIRS